MTAAGGRPPSHGGPEPDSTFKLLITTDNHLGFMERDPKRGDDSFTTFEEVLRAARVEHQVDCMLLGGDLFHENKPSLGCLNRTCTLFRKYLWGSKPIEFTLRSKAADNFPTHGLPLANWQDPNANISIPVFAIHGNHDDPVGGTSSLDILANNGHLNYFGLVSSLEEIVVQPVLLQKGHTHIALYGLGNVRDDRLHRCFQLKKVHFIHPAERTDAAGVPIRWFNILLLHQNRGMRDTRSKTGITEDMLAGFGFHLVIWGNEHEQRMVPEPTPHRYDIVQPGSTILTSITPMECNPKQYGVLEVRGTSYRLTPFPLRSVRPVVRRTVELCHDNPRGRTLDEVEEFLRQVVDEMIEEAEQQLVSIPDDVLQFHPNIRFPLMRLSVDFSDPESAAFPQPNFIRFGQQYMDVVANPGDMLKEIKASDKRSAVSRATILRRGMLGRQADGGGGGGSGGGGGDAFHYASAIPQFRSVDIAAKVAEVFRSGVRPPCQVLSEMELSAAVYAFAEKNERNAIEDKISEMLHTAQKMIWKRLGESDDILNAEVVTAEMRRCKVEREKKFFKEWEEMTTARSATPDGASVEGEEEEDEGVNGNARATSAPRGRANHREGDEDDERSASDRFAHLSQMFDGVGVDNGDGKGNSSSHHDRSRAVSAAGRAARDGDADEDPGAQLRRSAAIRGTLADGDVPSFLLDHMKVMRATDRKQSGDNGNRSSKEGQSETDRRDSDVEDGGEARRGPEDYAALLDAELEELPNDGLDRVTVDDFVAREVGEAGEWEEAETHDGTVRGGAKRTRAARAVVEVDVDDDEDDDGVGAHDVGGRRGLVAHVGQPTATKRRGERQPRGKTAGGGSAGPALHLISGKAGNTAKSSSARAAPSGGRGGPAGVQPLILTKWGASQTK